LDILQSPARSSLVADTPTRRFLAELWSTTQKNWLNPRQRIIAGAGVECVPSVHDRANAIHISDIVAAKPGQGAGRKALAHLLALADKHGVRLELTAKAYVKGRMTSKQLHDWYARLGVTTVSKVEHLRELQTFLRSALDYIDAVPAEIAGRLPAMPASIETWPRNCSYRHPRPTTVRATLPRWIRRPGRSRTPAMFSSGQARRAGIGPHTTVQTGLGCITTSSGPASSPETVIAAVWSLLEMPRITGSASSI
jgi:hypothetical protein